MSSKWACEYCTFENWSAAKKCAMCMALKPLYIVVDKHTVSENELDIYKLAPVYDGDGAGASISNSFRCLVCAKQNNSAAKICDKCGSELDLGLLLPTSFQDLSINTNLSDVTSHSSKNSPRVSPTTIQSIKSINNLKNKTFLSISKWTCSICTYQNWPKSNKCVLCLTSKCKSTMAEEIGNISDGTDILKSENFRNQSPQLLNRLALSSRDAAAENNGLHGAAAALDSNNCHNTEDCKLKIEEKKNRRRIRQSEILWLNACRAVVDGENSAIEAYLAAGGKATRQLTIEECFALGRPSIFQVGLTLVHIAIRFRREMIVRLLLAGSESKQVKKRLPSCISPNIASDILNEIAASLCLRKGDVQSFFITQCATFSLPSEIANLPDTAKRHLFSELLDQNSQFELEQEELAINWSEEIVQRLSCRLYALWNRTCGDCLLDSVLQATWGVLDQENILRRALANSLLEANDIFYLWWKKSESMQAKILNFALDETQWQHDWAVILSLASHPGSSLEQIHIFVLSHILRRPIIVYGIKFVKTFRGENIDFSRFQGIYLPFCWETSFCWRSPIALGYTRGHFCALVPLETNQMLQISTESHDINSNCPVVYLPLVDVDGQLLPIHFLRPEESVREETLLNMWMDCLTTESGILVACQKLHKKSSLVTQMIDEWIERYKQMRT